MSQTAALFLSLLLAATAFGTTPQPAASPANAAQATPKTEAQKDAIDSIDARITNLQDARDCINKAQSHQAVQACRAGLKQKQKDVKKNEK